MKKQTLIIITALVLVIILILGIVFFVVSKSTTTGSVFPSSFSSLFGDDGGILGDLFGLDDTQETTSNEENSTIPPGTLPALRQLYPYPISGMKLLSKETTDESGNKTRELFVRIMERSTGNIYDISVASNKATRITNTTYAETQESFFSQDGTHVISRSIAENGSTVTTTAFDIILGGEDVTGTDIDESIGSLKERFSKTNVTSLSVSPEGTRIFTVSDKSAGSSHDRFSFTDESAKQLLSSPLSEWISEWTKSDTVYLTTKPSAGVPGYAYTLDANTGSSLTKLAGGIPGMTLHMSSKKNLGLIGSGSRSSLTLSLLKDDGITSLPLSTLPEKCSWNDTDTGIYCGVPSYIPSASYPDAWYKGTVSFEDNIWYMNENTGELLFLASPSDYGLPSLDIINPEIDTEEHRLIFMNKNDMTPWILELDF
ncbi:MAG: hypothetical protein HGB03_03815 [Candidatus Yonathbacteria bacterium]|nr:hypothetical protein [Candidatus Yonathbacteria bacterium]NTW47642.1 hypothetical protein [Candidatus Yonathbacteria bacterium]